MIKKLLICLVCTVCLFSCDRKYVEKSDNLIIYSGGSCDLQDLGEYYYCGKFTLNLNNKETIERVLKIQTTLRDSKAEGAYYFCDLKGSIWSIMVQTPNHEDIVFEIFGFRNRVIIVYDRKCYINDDISKYMFDLVEINSLRNGTSQKEYNKMMKQRGMFQK